MKEHSVELYTINTNVRCLKCNGIGAVHNYGTYHPRGLDEKEVAKMNPITKKIMSGYIGKPFMSHSLGFGGTIPHKCMNCGNTGLVDAGGLEGYEKAFETIEKEEGTVDETCK